MIPPFTTVPSFVNSVGNLRSDAFAADSPPALFALLLLHAAKVTNEAAPNKPAIAFCSCVSLQIGMILE